MSYNDDLLKIINELSIGGEPADDGGDDGPAAPPPEDDEISEPTPDVSDDGVEEPSDEPPPDDGEVSEVPTDDIGDEPSDVPPEDTEDDDIDIGGNDDGPTDTPPADDEDMGDGGSDSSMDGPDIPTDDGDDGSENEDNSEESSEESDDENTEEDNTLENIKKIEEELFSSLSPEQIAIKNSELKGNFIELYTTIGTTLVRINDIPKSEDNIEILKFITDKLIELQEMINFNITVAYSTRTYIENNIIYQQCISTLNAIANIIDNIPRINNELPEDNEKDKDEGEPIEDSENDTETNALNVSDSSMSDYQEESASIFDILF